MQHRVDHANDLAEWRARSRQAHPASYAIEDWLRRLCAAAVLVVVLLALVMLWGPTVTGRS